MRPQTRSKLEGTVSLMRPQPRSKLEGTVSLMRPQTRGPMSQQEWSNKDPSLFDEYECQSKDENMKLFT